MKVDSKKTAVSATPYAAVVEVQRARVWDAILRELEEWPTINFHVEAK